MKLIRWLCNSNKTCLALLLPLTVGTALVSMLPAYADKTRECEGYGVVRDRSDFEAPILPRQSVAHCARSYQTLYQTYRVRRSPADSRTSESNIQSDIQSDVQNLRQTNPANVHSLPDAVSPDPGTQSGSSASTN